MQTLKKLIPYFITLIIVALLFSLLPKCGGETTLIKLPFDSTGIWKKQIQKHLAERKILLKKLEKKDSIQIKWNDRWHVVKNNIPDIQNAPCDSIRKDLPEVINTCDSALQAKDDYIATQSDVILQDGFIIDEQAKVIVEDSVKLDYKDKENKLLKHEVKKQKRGKWIASLIAVVNGVLAIIK